MLAYAPPEAMLHVILSTIGDTRAVRRAGREGTPAGPARLYAVKGWLIEG